MDPLADSVSFPAYRFPRPRGDGPWRGRGPGRAPRVPPPARGWTIAGRVVSWSGRGSPARAGMDLSQAFNSPPTMRFPRPRGDGPERPPHHRPGERVPPPARGWTLEHLGQPRGRHGSPARAGMDLHHSPLPAGPVWFPRPRGDGPPTEDVLRWDTRVPPPARGWTRQHAYRIWRGRGSPARAGMDPAPTTRRPGKGWFPRPRGDGPAAVEAAAKTTGVPPPARGWTLR